MNQNQKPKARGRPKGSKNKPKEGGGTHNSSNAGAMTNIRMGGAGTE